jgi:hypothetical protein
MLKESPMAEPIDTLIIMRVAKRLDHPPWRTAE